MLGLAVGNLSLAGHQAYNTLGETLGAQSCDIPNATLRARHRFRQDPFPCCASKQAWYNCEAW